VPPAVRIPRRGKCRSRRRQCCRSTAACLV
jgi:hypothetical protein